MTSPACPPWLEAMNLEFAFVTVGGGQKIARFVGGAFKEFLSLDAFVNLVRNRHKDVGSGNGGIGKRWLDHPHRRTYQGVTFAPGERECGLALNLWSGFGYEAKAGSVEPFLEFVRDVICDGDQERYAYVVAWIAQAVQEPGKKPGTALVLRGAQGTGKTTFANMVRGLFGEHAIVLASAAMLVRNFNNHLFGKAIVILEETPVQKKESNVVRDIITSDMMLYEPKGVDPFVGANCLHLIICTNEARAVYAQHDERRFAMFDVSERRKEDTRYFAELEAWYSQGGAEALLRFLLHDDWSGVDLRVVPRTVGLLEQKVESLDLIDRALYSMLQAGETGTGAPWASAQLRTFFVDAVESASTPV